MKGKKRDMQRSKAYAAERLCLGITSQPMMRFMDLSIWLRGIGKKYNVDVFVKDGRGRRKPSCGWYPTSRGIEAIIKIPRFARNKIIAMHELAHAIARDDPIHGRKWANTFLMLVKKHVGYHEWAVLRSCMKGCRVKWITHNAPKSQVLRKEEGGLVWE